MSFYKFMDREVRDYVASGSIRLGRLGYYRLLEAVTKDCWIGDRLEATSTDELRDVSMSPTSDTHERGRLRDFGLAINEEAQFRSSTIQRELHKDGFVYSFSKGELADLVEAMSAPSLKEYSYDGCVEIQDPNLLKSRIASATYNNSILSDVFHVEIDKMVYGDNRVINNPSPPYPSFFLKREIYERQKEWRVALVPINENLEISHLDFISILIDPVGVFAAVDIQVTKSFSDTIPADPHLAFERLEQFADQNRNDHEKVSKEQAIEDYWTLRKAGIYQEKA